MFIAAIVLLLVIGLSGLSAGVSLLGGMTSVAPVPSTGLAIGGGIAAYGLAMTIAGIGLWLRRAVAAWWLGIALIVGGLLFLASLMVAVGGLDGVFAFGIAVWGVTLGCLVAPATRAQLRRRPPLRP